MYIQTRIYAHIRARRSTHEGMHTHMYTHMHACMHTFSGNCLCEQRQELQRVLRPHTHTHTHTHKYTDACAHRGTHTKKCIHIWMHAGTPSGGSAYACGGKNCCSKLISPLFPCIEFRFTVMYVCMYVCMHVCINVCMKRNLRQGENQVIV
jgi:hypothetical protein